MERLSVIKVMTQAFITLQLSTPDPAPRERLVIGFFQETLALQFIKGGLRGRQHLFPSRRKFCVSSDAALDIVVALSVPAQVDGVRVHVDVHEVVDDLTLDVVLHPVHQEAPAHVHHLDERKVPVCSRESCR